MGSTNCCQQHTSVTHFSRTVNNSLIIIIMENWEVRIRGVTISLNNYIHTFCRLLTLPIILWVPFFFCLSKPCWLLDAQRIISPFTVETRPSADPKNHKDHSAQFLSSKAVIARLTAKDAKDSSQQNASPKEAEGRPSGRPKKCDSTQHKTPPHKDP